MQDMENNIHVQERSYLLIKGPGNTEFQPRARTQGDLAEQGTVPPPRGQVIDDFVGRGSESCSLGVSHQLPEPA